MTFVLTLINARFKKDYWYIGLVEINDHSLFWIWKDKECMELEFLFGLIRL